MARAVWTGSISFGLVEIPVTLHSAESPERDLKFHFLDRRTMKPVGYSRVNKATGQDVPWDEIVRAYEYEKGEYVVLTDEELAAANVEKSETIDIVGFVDLAEIDPAHFAKPYLLEPQKTSGRGYALLRAALERTGKAGIAQIVMRERQHLCAITARGSALELVTMRYADEVKAPAAVDAAAKSASAKETALAEQLIDGMTMKWKPSAFHDDYRDEVLALIKRKIKAGKTREILAPARTKRRGAAVIDLMPLLKKSLEGAGRRAKSGPRRRARKGA